MPPIAAFDSPELYAQTLDHEAVHATMAPHRLGRDFRPRYPETHYAVEELTAELGAAFHCIVGPSARFDAMYYLLRAFRAANRAASISLKTV